MSYRYHKGRLIQYALIHGEVIEAEDLAEFSQRESVVRVPQLTQALKRASYKTSSQYYQEMA